jgi:hypothetical protein
MQAQLSIVARFANRANHLKGHEKMETYVVKIDNPGPLPTADCSYWLRGTVWTGGVDRATRFATVEAAQAALDRAKPFTKPKLFRTAAIVAAD